VIPDLLERRGIEVSGRVQILQQLQGAEEAGLQGPVAVVEQGLQALEQVRNHLACAVKALQFQDMASQLIAHTGARLRNCADRLARDAFVGDEDGEAVVDAAPLRANPVTQSEMDTGFVELF
jgi:hypothetical protein